MSLAFASTAGPDCLKDVVPKYGLRLKVYRAIKEQLEHDQVKLLNYIAIILYYYYYYRKDLKNHKMILRSSWSVNTGIVLTYAIPSQVYSPCCAFIVHANTFLLIVVSNAYMC